MTIAAQLTAYQKAFQEWAQKDGGKCLVAKDKSHLWQMLFASPTGLNVLVWFMREVPRGEFGISARTGKVDRHFQAVFTRGAGFKLNPADSLTQGAGGGKAMFDVVEAGRDLLRSLILPELSGEDRVPDYTGIELLDVGGTDLRVDAYEINWSVGVNLKRVSAGPVEEI